MLNNIKVTVTDQYFTIYITNAIYYTDNYHHDPIISFDFIPQDFYNHFLLRQLKLCCYNSRKMILEDSLYDLLVIPEDLICIRCFNRLLWLICRNEILIYDNNNCILDNKNMNISIERVCNSFIDMNGVVLTYILSTNNTIQQISYDKTNNKISIKQISMTIPSNKVYYIYITF